MSKRPDAETPVAEVTDGVYDLTLGVENRARYRSFLFDWEQPTLVDCGFDRTTETLFERIEEVGTVPENLVLTHQDRDHAGGFDAVVERYGLTTWVPEQSELPGERTPDRRFGHEDSVGPFTAVHIPGHRADNHALVATERPLAVVGDAMIGADWRGLPPGYFVMVEAMYSEDMIAAERYIERLQEYEFDVGLVFHGSSVLEDAGEKLDAFIEFPNRRGGWGDRFDDS